MNMKWGPKAELRDHANHVSKKVLIHNYHKAKQSREVFSLFCHSWCHPTKSDQGQKSEKIKSATEKYKTSNIYVKDVKVRVNILFKTETK